MFHDYEEMQEDGFHLGFGVVWTSGSSQIFPGSLLPPSSMTEKAWTSETSVNFYVTSIIHTRVKSPSEWMVSQVEARTQAEGV